MKNFKHLAWAATSLLSGLLTAQAGQTAVTETTTSSEDSPSALESWWNGKYATGNWFGLRDTLVDHGVTIGGEWKANYLAIVNGGLQQRGGFDEELKFRITLDAAKLTGWDAIEGLTFFTDVRYRDGDGVNKYTGASNTFAPSTFQGGKQWRFQNAYATYTTPELFGVKEFFTLSLGWQNPADIFIKQPESKFFVNNTFTSARGIGANGIPWGGSYAAWGGYARVKPTDWSYVQSGLYLAAPNGTNTRNNGLYFQGFHPDPNLNGLYWLTELGLTPKIGPSKLPGRYAAGFLYWGVENSSYYGTNHDQRVLFYWQADQMLFREKSPEAPAPLAKGPSDGKSVADGKSFKAAPTPKTKLNEQGLYFFSLTNFAPAYNNPLPFYFQTGLIYKGLIPTRDADQLGVAIGYGNYSFDKIQSEEARDVSVHQTYEAVVEVDYRVQINQWAYIQPLVQYIIRPNGTGLVHNDTILGFQMGLTF